MASQTKDELFCKYFLSAWSITHKTITHHVYNISKTISLMRRFLHTRPRGHDVSMSNTNQVHPQSYSIHHETKQPYWHGNDKLARRENLADCIASSVDVANEPQAVDIRPQCMYSGMLLFLTRIYTRKILFWRSSIMQYFISCNTFDVAKLCCN